jgi:hypothetical protein
MLEPDKDVPDVGNLAPATATLLCNSMGDHCDGFPDPVVLHDILDTLQFVIFSPVLW